jgi:D-sedoheptulose 7-phosphate isomerase
MLGEAAMSKGVSFDAEIKGIWRSRISAQLRESAALKLKIEGVCADAILEAAWLMAGSLAAGGKLMLCGNGGSAADAQHLAGEFINRLTRQFLRPPMAAIALTTDSSCITAAGNDFGFERVFERQVVALGRPGDVLVAISTSGRSENVIRAVKSASQVQVATIGLLGQGGGELTEMVDRAIIVPSDDVQRIQEGHITIGHILCSLVERMVCRDAREAPA